MTVKTMRVLAAVCVVAWSVPTWAAECTEDKEKAASTMGEAVYHGVEEATKLMARQQHADAIEKLNKLTESGTDFEKAVVYYNLGLAYSSKNDYAGASKAFAKAVSLKALPSQ